jgi:hypothetical protein
LVSKPTMDPRYFGTVNRARQIPPMPGIGAGLIAQGRSFNADRSRLRHLCATWDAVGNQRFVDSDRRFGLYNQQLVMRLFGANGGGQRVNTRCGKSDR